MAPGSRASRGHVLATGRQRSPAPHAGKTYWLTGPELISNYDVAAVLSNSNLPRAEQDLKSYLASAPDRSDWPSHAAAREWLGRLYELQGNRTAAAEQYRAALQLEPKNKDAQQRLQKLEKSSQ